MSTFYRFPGGLRKAVTLSYDDGVEQDIRLMEILDKHGIRCTFNLNSGCWAKEGTVYPAGHIHRRMSASLLDTFSCFAQGLIPYGAQLLMAAGLASITPFSIIGYLYYPFALGAIALLGILIGYPRKYSR